MTETLLIGAVDGQAVRLELQAMATRFELVYWGPRAAGDEALAEIVRTEARLSASQSSSDVSWINAHAGMRAVRVEPRTFTLLQHCVELAEQTDGAFDISVGPLLQAWTFAASSGASPSQDLVADARTRVGYRHLHLDPRTSTIRFGRAGMRLDLGAVAKGCAIDAAIAVLRAHGVQAALLHGGSSRVHAIGDPPEGGWTVAWERPGEPARAFRLRDSALSMSALRGEAVTADGRPSGHVFDPLLGLPAQHAAAVVTGPDSVECDALSTALLVLGADWLPVLGQRFPGYTGEVA